MSLPAPPSFEEKCRALYDLLAQWNDEFLVACGNKDVLMELKLSADIEAACMCQLPIILEALRRSAAAAEGTAI